MKRCTFYSYKAELHLSLHVSILCCITHCQKFDTWKHISSSSVFRSGVQILCSGPHIWQSIWLGCLIFHRLEILSNSLLIEFISLLLYPLRAHFLAGSQLLGFLDPSCYVACSQAVTTQPLTSSKPIGALIPDCSDGVLYTLFMGETISQL